MDIYHDKLSIYNRVVESVYGHLANPSGICGVLVMVYQAEIHEIRIWKTVRQIFNQWFCISYKAHAYICTVHTDFFHPAVC